MMKSLYASVSGLRAQQTKMDVIGNNIANVNTVAFRGSRVSFAEVFSQTIKSGSSPDAVTGRGGTNPMQIGLGVGVGAIDTSTARGSLQRTDNPTDLAIEGDGFFISKGGNNEPYEFTRAGNFGVDRLGNIVTANGKNVYGWQDYGGKVNDDGTYTFDTDKLIEPINIYSDIYNKNKRMIASKATTEESFAGNLDATQPLVQLSDPPQTTIPITIYDSLGNETKVSIEFRKTSISDASSTTWTWSIASGSGVSSSTATGVIKFDTKGQIMPGPLNNPTLKVIPGAGTGTDSYNVTLDFTKLNMYAADFSVNATGGNGYPTGSLVTFNIGSDGLITGVYSNGKQQPLGLLGMAGFDNPAALQRVGDNMYLPTTNSGDFKTAFKAGTGDVGVINPGTLEMSNVDLAREFTEMIVTQRAFQANSRIVTTVDEMLQEITSMKR